MATNDSEPDLSGFDFAEESNADDSDDDAEWLDLDEGDHVVGELREVKENCGEFDSRVYTISRGPGDEVLMWGKASIDRGIDNLEAEPGDVVFIQNTGEQFETDDGNTGTRYKVARK